MSKDLIEVFVDLGAPFILLRVAFKKLDSHEKGKDVCGLSCGNLMRWFVRI